MKTTPSLRLAAMILIAALPLSAPASERSKALAANLAAGDRPDADKQRDAGRKPAEVIAFLGIEPGMTVVDLIASGGHYTDVLSVAVGEDGKVYAQNSPSPPGGNGGGGGGNNQASAKATVKVSPTTLIEYTEGMGWTTLLSNALHTPNQKDLFIGGSLECGLFTSTEISSQLGNLGMSEAHAAICVRVLVDGYMADPGVVTFASRTQKLEAIFQGLIAGCLSVDPLTGNVILDEACVEPEVLSLLLESISSNHFNFVYADLSSGVHTIELQAAIATNTEFTENSSAEAMALIGKGSLVVEEIRLIQDEDIILE